MLMLALSLYGNAQDVEEINAKLFELWAGDFMDENNYVDALEIYTILDSIKPNTPDYIYNRGVCHYHAIDKPTSLNMFLKSLTLGYDNIMIHYYLGRAYQFNYDYENATYHLNRYLTSIDSVSDTEKYQSIKNILLEVDNARHLLSDKLSVKINNLGPGVNSELPDYVPLVIDSGKTLIFTSRRGKGESNKKAHDGHFFEDIYVSHQDSLGEWITTKSHENFNSNSHDAVVSMNWKGDKLFVYRSNTLNGGDIYMSQKIEGKWLKPKKVKGINSAFWEGSVALSKDEKKIFFSSDRPGGYGGSDIYEATLSADGKQWENVINLGATINTTFDEDAPYIHTDDKTLFFSSRGHHSGGGYDIYSAKLINNEWTHVKNLGFPINTADDDIYFHLTMNGAKGYFTSHRHSNYSSKSIGEKDLFELNRPHQSPFYFVLKGKMFNNANNEPVTGIVTLIDKHTGKQTQVIADINSGKFKFDIKFENKYEINVAIGDNEYFSKQVYFPYEVDLFESLIDIPILNLPSHSLKLTDLSFDSKERDSVYVNNIIVDKQEPTILLTRKYDKNNTELRQLLTSKSIPFAFRKKLMKQLKKDSVLDQSDFSEEEFEGNDFEMLFSDGDDEFNKKLDKLDDFEFGRLERAGIRRVYASGTKHTIDITPIEVKKELNKLDTHEKELVEKFSNYLITEELQEKKTIKTVDRLRYDNLNAKKKALVNKIVLSKLHENEENIDENIKADSSFIASLESDERELFTELLKKVGKDSALLLRERLRINHLGNAWNKLITVETTGFKSHYRLRAFGNVLISKNDKRAKEEQLLLVDDYGNILQQIKTDSSGNFTFNNLLEGQRYHVLIDDYLLSITGHAKFKIGEFNVVPMDEDYYNFYDQLTESEKRRVDRIIAYQNLKEQYEDNPDLIWEDKVNFEKLKENEKGFVGQFSKYMNAKLADDNNFEIERSSANKYEQMDLENRKKYNRYITQATLHYDTVAHGYHLNPDDSIYYEQLNSNYKKHLQKLKSDRFKQNIIFDNLRLQQAQVESWVTIGNINTEGNKHKWLNIKGHLLHKIDLSKVNKVKLALLDTAGLVVTIFTTDSVGNFDLESVRSEQDYKVLLSLNNKREDVKNYSIVVNAIEKGEENFYDQLKANEKRIIDRMITALMADEILNDEHELVQEEKIYFDMLSEKEKNFLYQLNQTMFIENLIASNLSLENEKVSFEHMLTEETEVIKRDILRSKVVPLLFKTEEVELVESAWMQIGAFSTRIKPFKQYNVSGVLRMKSDTTSSNIAKIILTSNNNEVIQFIYPNEDGSFVFSALNNKGLHKLFVEDKNGITNQSSKFTIINLIIDYEDQIDDPQSDKLNIDPITVYFRFDDFSLSEQSKRSIDEWCKRYSAILNENIIIEGHTDLVGSSSYNQLLSRKRANTVRNHLITLGFKPENLTLMAKGEDSPVINTEKANKYNRRVIIKTKQ